MTKFTLAVLLTAIVGVVSNSPLSAQRVTVTVAGNGSTTFNGDGKPGHLSNVSQPYDVCRDAANNLYFTDGGNGRIRKISGQTGVITTVAGGGSSAADGIPATDALLTSPGNICIDGSGNLYVVTGAGLIRKINTAGIISTTASTGATVAGICADAMSNIYYVDQSANMVRVVNALTGIITTVAGIGAPGYTGDGGPAIAAKLNHPATICTNPAGEILFADQDMSLNSVIRKISTTGIITTVAGNTTATVLYNIPAMSCWLGMVTGLCSDDTGNIFFNEVSCSCRKIVHSSDSVFQVGGDFYTQSYSDNINSNLANMNNPYGMCAAPHGTVYIADKFNNRIRKSVQVTHTPSFVFGNGQFITPCPGYAFPVDSQMAITDLDAGQTETWTVLTAPVHGTLTGFPATVTSTGPGVILLPAGTSYMAPGAYLGTDSFKVRVTDGTLSDTVTMYVSVQPGSPGTISGASNVCPTASITLSETAPGGIWSASNAAASINPATGVVTGVTAGTDTIIYSVYTTCYVTTSTVITVNPLPATGTIGGPDSVCAGSTIPLTETVPGGIWSSMDVTFATVSGTGVVSGVLYGSTDIEYTTSNAWCSATTFKTVDVITTATPITGPGTVCIGTGYPFYDDIPGGTWSATNGNATVSMGGMVTGVTPGLDTIMYTNTNTCGTATVSTTVSVATAPDPGVISGPSSVCSGMTVTLTSTAPGGTWSDLTGYAYVDPSGVVTGMGAGTDSIIYTVSLGAGCTASTEVLMTITTVPDPGTISGPGSVCAGASITLTDTVSGGIWSVSGTGAIVSLAGVVFGVTTGTPAILYSVTNSCGTAVDSVIISVDPLPDAGTISGMTGVCPGATIALTDGSTGGTWSVTNANATVSGTGTVGGVTPGSDSVLYTVTNTCGTVSAVSVITINTLPDAGTISGDAFTVCTGATISLTDAAGGGSWSANNGNCSVSGTGVVSGITPGNDTIAYTVTNSCGSARTNQSVTVIKCSGVGLPTIHGGQVRIFPNPASSVINIEWGAAMGNAMVVIHDVTGREVTRTTVDCSANTGTAQLTTDLKEGIYLLTISSDSVYYTEKLAIIR